MVYDLLGDTETQANAGWSVLNCASSAKEPLEDSHLVGLGNTEAKILHPDGQPPIVACNCHNDSLGVRRVLDRISNQITQYLSYTRLVANECFSRLPAPRNRMHACS